jgi:membrane-associated phospholipid phosphatase
MRLLLVTLSATTILAGAPLSAQSTPNQSNEPLFTLQDAAIGGGFVLGTVILAPLDRAIAEQLQDSVWQANRAYQRGATGFNLLAFPGSVAITGTLYAVGRLADRPRMADLGLHTTEAIVLGEAFNFLIKGLAGRARPYNDPTNPRDFKLRRGFRRENFRSFPSGHAVAGFAAAAAVTSEVARHWPEYRWFVGPTMYGGATLVGLSRMYGNYHWASDVVIGSAIGTFSGLKVVKYHHSHPGNRIDRWFLGVSLTPGGPARIWLTPIG